MTSERLRTVTWWLSFSVCGLILAIHFSVVQLYNMPLSPLKLSLVNQLNDYVNPFFAQRWSFFAPSPIDRSYSLVARSRYVDEKSRDSKTTGWLDISDPLIDAIRRDRLTPLFDVEIGVSNALISLVNALPSQPGGTYTKDGKSYVKPQIPSGTDPSDMMILRRTALAMLEVAYPRKSFQQIQLGVVVGVFPRFTERNDANVRTQWSFFSVGWQPAERVATWCCQYGGVSRMASVGGNQRSGAC